MSVIDDAFQIHKQSGIKIKCPNSFILKPGRLGFEIEPNSLAKKFSEAELKSFGLKNWRFKRNKWGKKIPKWDDYYQPSISKTEALENVYDPDNWVCKYQCRGKCLEGLGHNAWMSVKRLKAAKERRKIIV